MTDLTLDLLMQAAREFLSVLGARPIPELYGVTDGKAVGTYVEQAFHEFLLSRYKYLAGSAASGRDFPVLGVDLKVTSIKQPQSSCPFTSASQKVYGLGYHLLVFVYDKVDDAEAEAARLGFEHALFIENERTADYQTTYGLLEIIRREGNTEDVAAFLDERNLPLDDIGRAALAEKILKDPPKQGVLTMSNALQWRLQYGRAITAAGREQGVVRIL